MRADIRGVFAGTASVAAVASIVMVLVSIGTFLGGRADAADGPQRPPSIEPASIASAADAFALRPPAGARCEEDGTGVTGDTEPGPRTGADNWRWHGFIVEAGRDVSTLRFEPIGPGTDYDATDGNITAPLLGSSGEPLVQMLPAIRPEGLINPDQLAGLALDPSIFRLTAGDYTVGFACTDPGLDLRQWWSTTVTIGASGSSFLTATDRGAGVNSVDSGSASEGSVRGTAVDVDVADEETVPAPVSHQETTPSLGEAVPTSAVALVEGPASASASPTGVSWSPLVAFADAPAGVPVGVWSVLAIVFARMAHLLVQPVRRVPALRVVATRPVEVQRIPT